MTMIMTMTSTRLSMILTLAASVWVVGCSDDGVLNAPANDGSGTAGNGATTQLEDATTVPPPEGTGSDGVDASTGGPALTTSEGPGSTSIEPDPTSSDGTVGATGTSGDSSTSDSGTSDSGTSGGASPFEGGYDGTWDGMCPGFGAVAGTLMFDVAADGTLTGSIAGVDNGPLVGTVDDMGAVAATANAMIAGMCPFDGQIDMMGNVTGMWSCPIGCMGTWAAQVS